jgi:hypothetical protein
MAGIQHILQKKFFVRSVILLCATIVFFFLSTSFAYAQNPVANGINTLVFNMSASIGGFIAGLGGVLLDISTDQMVLRMGYWFTAGGIGAVVTSIWTMIRDLFNILFIFSLVYIGLRTILYSDDSGTKKMLGMLIAAALLINFSLYIAKVVVDVSNFTAIQVYETATKGITTEAEEEGYSIGRTFITGDSSIAGAYMEVLNISSWFDDQDDVSTGLNTIAYSVFMMLFLGFLGFVFAYGAIMLVWRFLAIIFYLMFSPLMFLGWVLPQFQSISTKWWKGFIAWSFYAPVYIFMLYVGLYALEQMKSTFTGSFSDSFQEGAGFSVSTIQVFLFYMIGVGFLIGAMRVADAMSQGGAAVGMGAADKISRKIVGTASGAVYRQTGGRLAGGAMAAMDRADRRLAAQEGRHSHRSWLGRTAAGGFGMRSIAREAVGGTTTRGGVETARNYGAGGRGRKQVEDDMKTQNTRTTSANITADATGVLNDTTAGAAEKQKAVQKLNSTDIIAMSKTTKGLATLKANAHHLTPEHIKALSDDKEGDRNAVNAIKANRTAETLSKFTTGATPKEIKDANADELDSLGFGELVKPEFAVHLSEDKIDKLKFVASEKEQIKEARKTEIKAIADGTSTSGVTVADLMKFKGADVAKFPDAALINMATHLNKGILHTMRKNLTQSDATMIQLRNDILNGGNIKMGRWLTSNPEGLEFGT